MNCSYAIHTQMRQILWLLIFFAFSVICKNAALAQQRYQAMSLSFLTELPERDGSNVQFASEQKPNKGELKVSSEARITPPFAYDRPDQYVAPDFNSFFPDDPAGGKQLDALFSGSLGGHHKPEDVLAAIRQGLRHTQVYQSQVLAQVGGFVWGVKEQNPQAIELLYHASDTRGPVSYDGMYYGLTVLKNRPTNVVRTLINNYDSFTGELNHRIGWGLETYGNTAQFADELDKLLEQPESLDDCALVAALGLYEKAAGKPFSKIEAMADRGKFVLGFTHQDSPSDQELREHLGRCVDPKSILSFVTRIDQGNRVGVCLLQGIGSRDQLLKRLNEDPRSKIVFSETFSPTVLMYRQLREFAEYLPNGLPKGAKPPYEAPPENESFAFNATDGYRPPDYANFFPMDVAAGKKLDELYRNRESTELTVREQLEIFQAGLKTANEAAKMMGWIASIAGWPEDPLAKEIFYHAADPKSPATLRHGAIYFGLSGNWEMPPNVLQLVAEILIHAPSDPMYTREDNGRITWSLTTEEQKKVVAAHLDKAMEKYDNFTPEKLVELTAIYEQLTKRKPSHFEKFADAGTFVVAFRHRDKNSPEAMSDFCQSQFHEKPYVEKYVIGAEGKIKGAAAVIVKGQRGIEQCVVDLKKDQRIQFGFAGAISQLKQVPEWKTALEGQTAIEGLPNNYVEAFEQLYRTLGNDYAHFEVKQIDWKAVGDELLPRSKTLKTRDEFCLLCQELVARLEDSHAYLIPGKLQPASVPVPLFDPGFACLLEADQRLIVYHVDPQSSAQLAGLKVGSVVTHVSGIEAGEVLNRIMTQTKRYAGYSSERYLKYHAAQWLGRQMEKGAPVTLRVIEPDGNEKELKTNAESGVRYLPRLPVPIAGIEDSASIDWTRLDEKTGYIFIRQIRDDLNTQLDAAVKELGDCKGLILDVRGNSGGGFDAARSFGNFDVSDKTEPDRPKFTGPIAVLIDARCISAGEGWVSWFRAKDGAKFFGTTTAGASSRKNTVDVLGGTYRVIYSVKAYRGFLDRPIERIGIEPDVVVHHTAESIANGKDEVLEAARSYLSKLKE